MPCFDEKLYSRQFSPHKRVTVGPGLADMYKTVTSYLPRRVPQVRDLQAVELNGRRADVIGQVDDKLQQQPREARDLQHKQAHNCDGGQGKKYPTMAHTFPQHMGLFW